MILMSEVQPSLQLCVATKIFVQQLLVMSDYTKVINDFYCETCQGICYHNIKLPSLHQSGKIGPK